MIRYSAYRGGNYKPPPPPEPERPPATYHEVVARIRRRHRETHIALKILLRQLGLRPGTFYVWDSRPDGLPKTVPGRAFLKRIDDLTHRW